MEERLIQGMGYGDARTVTDSPGDKTYASCPSIDTPAGARLRSPIYHEEMNSQLSLDEQRNEIRQTGEREVLVTVCRRRGERDVEKDSYAPAE